jgi:hypothetical protein
MRSVARPGWGLTAVALAACTGGDPSAPPAPLHDQPAAIPVEPLLAEPDIGAEAPAPPRGTHRAIAADLAGSGEPIIAVTGCHDAAGSAEVALYAQRAGGWRRIGGGAWPDGESSSVSAVDAADLDGDHALELAALGTAGEGRAHLAIYRMRDRDLDLVAETGWNGHPGALEIVEVQGRPVILIRNRRGRARRAFALDGEMLAERPTIDAVPSRRAHSLEMSLPSPSGPLRVAIAGASGGPSMLSRIAAWNDELARLRQP